MADSNDKKKATRKKTPESKSGAVQRTSKPKSKPVQKKKGAKKTVTRKKGKNTQVSENEGISKNDILSTADKKRSDWEFNQVTIQDAFVKLLKKKKRKPTAAELSEHTGLSVSTIDRHVKQMKFEMQSDTWRTLTPTVIHAIHKGAVRGGVFAQKLWLQVVEGWSEDINLNHGAQESLADVIAQSTGIKMRKDIEKNAKSKR